MNSGHLELHTSLPGWGQYLHFCLIWPEGSVSVWVSALKDGGRRAPNDMTGAWDSVLPFHDLKDLHSLWDGNRNLRKKSVKRNVSFPWKKAHPWVWACVCWLWDYTESSPSLFIKKQRVQKFSIQQTKTQGEWKGEAIWQCFGVSRVTALHFFPAAYGRSPRAAILSSLVFCQLWNASF